MGAGRRAVVRTGGAVQIRVFPLRRDIARGLRKIGGRKTHIAERSAACHDPYCFPGEIDMDPMNGAIAFILTLPMHERKRHTISIL
jgi:hypothetical protein